MDFQSGVVVALTLGFLLGLKHATDADHVVAVTTIVSESRNALRGIWIGASWALGHTTPLVFLGVVILLLKEALLTFYNSVVHIFEFGVGLMLVLLALQVFWKLRSGNLHVHDHHHDGATHIHIHVTHDESTDANSESTHGFLRSARPFFRLKSYVIGVVHGLAGSAAIMLVLIPEIDSFWVGIGYLAMFGTGTLISMAIITMLLGIPFAMSTKFERLNQSIAALAGVVSLLFGFAIISDITFNTSFNPI